MKKKKFNFNEFEILFLKNAFENSSLMPRIKSLIIHGSSLYYPLNLEKKDSDIDLELILTSENSEDLKIVRDIVRSSKVRVECQLRYFDEIKKGLIFQSSYKIFMFFAYANGVVLIGENVYKKLSQEIPEEKVEKSVVLSVQIAFKNIRKLFLSGANEYSVNKGIMEVFRLICMFNKSIEYKMLGSEDYFNHQTEAFISLILKTYQEFLDKEDGIILNGFIRYYKSCRFFQEVFPVVNKIVTIFSENLKGGQDEIV